MPMLDILQNIFKSSFGICKTVAGYVITISGVILLAYATFRTVQNVMKGAGGSAWVMPIVDICFAGIFLAGFNFFVGRIGGSGGDMLASWTGVTGGGGTGVYTGGSAGINFAPFFSMLETTASGVASGIAQTAGAVMTIIATIEFMRILTKPTPASPVVWVTAFVTLFVGSIFQNNSWWTGGKASAKGFSKAFVGLVESAAGGNVGGGTGGISISGGGVSWYDGSIDGGSWYDGSVDDVSWNDGDVDGGSWNDGSVDNVGWNDGGVDGTNKYDNNESDIENDITTTITTTIVTTVTTSEVITEPTVTTTSVVYKFDSDANARYTENEDGTRTYVLSDLTMFTEYDEDGNYLGKYYISPYGENKGSRVYVDGSGKKAAASGSVYYEIDENTGEQMIFTPKRNSDGSFIYTYDESGNKIVDYDSKYVRPTENYNGQLLFIDGGNEYYCKKTDNGVEKIYVAKGTFTDTTEYGTTSNVPYFVESEDGKPISSAEMKDGTRICVNGKYFDIKESVSDTEKESVTELYFMDGDTKHIVSTKVVKK